MQDMPQWMGIVIATCRKTTSAALLVWRQNQHLSFLRTTAGLGLSNEKVFANSAQTKKSTNGKKETEMNTTHTNEPTEPNAKSMEGRLLETISLRDYFAAKAMQAVCAPSPTTGQYPQKNEFQWCAETAYALADAMLKARES
jgi:hypothetical protein